MALAIDNTLSGENSNSYIKTAYADDYWDNHYNTSKAATWQALSDGQKTTLLIHACRVLETARYTFNATLPEYAIHYDKRTGQIYDVNLTRDPVKYYYYQRLQFPRNLDVYVASAPTGSALGNLYIPDPMMEAQCEQAVFMASVDTSAIANRLQGITLDKISLGRGQIETTQEYAVTGSMFDPVAFELVRPFIVRGAALKRR